MSNDSIIKLGGKEFGVMLDWLEIVGKKNIVRSKIKENLKKKKADGFGVKIEHFKDSVQVGFSNRNLKNKPSLAKFLSGKEEFRNALILLSTDDEEFWMCSIAKNGYIEQGSDNIYEDKETFIEAVRNYVTLLADDDFKIVLSDSDKDLMETLIGDEISGFEIEAFDEKELFSESTKSAEINLIYNGSVDVIKQLSTLGLIGVIATSGYFFVFLEDPLYKNIIDQEVSNSFYQDKSSYEKFIKEQDKKLSNSYEKIAKKEILESRLTAYNKNELYKNIQNLQKIFPLYLVEWEIESISYNNDVNETFSVVYKKIKDSFGNTEELKASVNKILNQYGIKDPIFRKKSADGDLMSVNLSFKKKADLKLNQNQDQSKINDKVKDLEKEVDNYHKAIEDIEFEVSEFSFMDKRFGSSLVDKEQEILDLIAKSKNVYKKMKDERSKLEVDDIKIDESLISGSFDEMLRMDQYFSYYKWSLSKNSKQYPASQEKNKKDLVVKYYAKSTIFDVSDAGNFDVLGIDGIKTILLSKEILDKKFIKINNITLNIKTQSWNIQGEYYEKI